jgi:hypothetical protein
MKYWCSSSTRLITVVVGASLAVMLLVLPIPALAQNAAKTPMTADGHSDFNGFWNNPPAQTTQQFQRTADGSILFDFSIDQGKDPLCVDESCQVPNQPPYKPEYMEKVKKIAATMVGGTTPLDPEKSCKPAGIPRANINNTQIVQTPQIIALIKGDYTDRLIYLDGRPHPPDLEPSWMGHSIGHWEGNTLVVDTIGFNDETWLGGDVGGHRMYTSIHSDKEHVIERWTRNGDVLTVETTVEDPVMFTRPWVLAPRSVRLARPDDYLVNYFCDGGAVSELLRSHYVKPDPNDRDIKYLCSGHRCDGPPAAAAPKQPAKATPKPAAKP